MLESRVVLDQEIVKDEDVLQSDSADVINYYVIVLQIILQPIFQIDTAYFLDHRSGMLEYHTRIETPAISDLLIQTAHHSHHPYIKYHLCQSL